MSYGHEHVLWVMVLQNLSIAMSLTHVIFQNAILAVSRNGYSFVQGRVISKLLSDLSLEIESSIQDLTKLQQKVRAQVNAVYEHKILWLHSCSVHYTTLPGLRDCGREIASDSLIT